MKNISELSNNVKKEVAVYIKNENLEKVNSATETVVVKDTFYTRYGKRLIDITVSLMVLTATLPINLLLAVITYFDVGRPLLFKQKRTGKNEKPFYIYKFRSMTNAADENGELLPPMQRVTRWGEFVRKTSLDEFLNFVSILKGDMSLVGPRPLLDDYLERFNIRDRQRYAVRPGLECPSVKKLDHVMSWQERLDNDIWYIQNCSLMVDIILVFRIVQIAFDKKTTAMRSKAEAGGFLGYDTDGSIITTRALPDKYWERYCREHQDVNMINREF